MSRLCVRAVGGRCLFAGAAVAVLGSLPPAGWAARIRTAAALRAE